MDEMGSGSQPAHGGPPPPPPGPGAGPPETGLQQARGARVDIIPGGSRRGPSVDARMVAVVAAVAVVLAALVFGGMSLLGSEDDDEADPVAAVAASAPDDAKKDRFIIRGDTLCQRATRAQERLLYPDTPAEFPPYLDKVRGILVGLIKDLKGLPQPKQDAGLLKKMYAQVERLPGVLTEARAAAVAGDVTALQQIIARGEKIEQRANALALQYGFMECSQP